MTQTQAQPTHDKARDEVPQTYEALNIGDIQILQIVDGTSDFAFPAKVCYPDVDPEEWEPYRKLYPEGFSDTNYHFHFGGILIRSGEKIAIVDTGIGTDPHPSLYAGPKPGKMLQVLENEGVKPEDIDVVFLTHCHPDHTGWNTTPKEFNPTFPNAKYVVNGKDYEAFMHPDGPEKVWPYRWMHEFMTPLLDDHKMLHLFDGTTEIVPNARAIELPGHTPGHSGILVELGDESALLLGDAMCSPMGCTKPDMVFAYDVGHAEANATRRKIVDEARSKGWYLVSPHFPYSGYGRIVEDDAGTGHWRPHEGDRVMAFDE
jgi:glyoxylase-like metal-dependent hydrolase (beta-lactamase superfamily II)